MDVNKAIRYVTEDKQWITKLIIAILMSVLGFLIIPALILQGYLVKIIRHVMGGSWSSLPEWEDWGGLLRDGFFVAVAQFLYTLPFIILVIIGLAATGGVAGLSGSDDIAAAVATGGGLLLFCMIILFAVALLFLTPALLIQYSIKDDFGALFRVGEIVDLIRNNLADILVAFLVTIVAVFAISIVAGIIGIIPCIGWVVSFLIGLALGPYVSFISGHLYGQIAAKILGNKAGGDMAPMV